MQEQLLDFPALCRQLVISFCDGVRALKVGAMPPPSVIERDDDFPLLRWRQSQVDQWIEDGCPKFPAPHPHAAEAWEVFLVDETSRQPEQKDPQ